MNLKQEYRASGKSFLLLTIILPLLSNGAQAPSGHFSYVITPQNGVALWNFSGLYSFPFFQELQLHQDATGKTTALYESNAQTNVVLTGTIRGTGSDLRPRLRSTAAFQEYVLEGGFYAMRKDNLRLSFNAGTHTFRGTDRVNRTREELVMDCPGSFWECDHWKTVRTTSSFTLAVELSIPQTTDGNWTLDLDIVPVGNRLSGTASIGFSNGEEFKFQLLGNYAPKTQKTKLVLKGAGEDKGATLILSLSGPDVEIQWIRGMIGGQTIRFP